MAKYLLVIFLSFPLYSNAQITYSEHIAPIIESNCTSCHSDGNIGPMSLESYEDVASYASMIKFVTQNKLMPPFKANHSTIQYANARIISEEELALIESWINEGLKEGNSILPKTEIPTIETEFDTVICMNQAFEHFGIYYDQYQAFVLPVNNAQDKLIKQIHFLPGNKEIVRSANLSIAEKGKASDKDTWDPRLGFYSYAELDFNPQQPNWFNWMPNTPSSNLLSNEHLLMPANSEIILQLHYGPFGEIQKDSSCIALNYQKDPFKGTQLQNVPLISTDFLSDTFQINAGEKSRFSSSFYIPEDTQLKSITPLAHLLCTSWEVIAVLPSKETLPLLKIEDWDFHWKEKYVFSKKINLPKGTKIIATAKYDNTASNPYNPSDPPHNMQKGPHMYDENFLCYFEFAHSTKNKIGTIKKPFSVASNKVKTISFETFNKAGIQIILHDLSNQEKIIIADKIFPKGKHKILTSKAPEKTGRYAISLNSENTAQDLWYFIIK